MFAINFQYVHLTNSEQWIALSYHLGIKGFFIAVRGGVDDLSGPRLFFTNKAEKFACAVLDLEPHCLALKLEAFVITGLGNLFNILS